MITHIVAWNFKSEFTKEECTNFAAKIKFELESLKSIIPYIKEINVKIEPISSSGRSIMLYSLFESEQTLAMYQVHPNHQRVSKFVGSVTTDRICLDFNS